MNADRGLPQSEDDWTELLAEHRQRLRRMVELRLHPRLRGRIDPSDVVQEVCLAAAEHLRQSGVRRASFYLWLRVIAGNKLLELHRRHLDAQMRAADREVSIFAAPGPEATSMAIAASLVGHATGPSHAAARNEIRSLVHQALEGMAPIDRDVLALRHFEQLSTAETAEVLGIEEKAASKRYLRALGRLKEALASVPGGEELCR